MTAASQPTEATDDFEASVPRREDPTMAEHLGAMRLLRRGLTVSPEFRQGLVVTAFAGIAVAAGKLTVPIVIQRALDRDLLPNGEVDTGFMIVNAGVALLIVAASALGSWWTQRRLVERAETGIASLRVLAFDHIHQLSVADHNDTKRGVLVARVTSDAEALARFAQWGLFSWTINPSVIVGIVAVLAYYSWAMALVVVVAYLPVFPVLRQIQRRQMLAYDRLRTTVADMLAAFSESVTGAAVIRAYGAESRSRTALHDSIDRRYRARLKTNRYVAGVFVVGDLFGGIAFCGVLAVGVWQRDALGLTAGELVACLFLTTLVYGPVGELAETMDQTQMAVAGWRKILTLLDHPIDVIEPADGSILPAGPIGIAARSVSFAYRDSGPVLVDVDVEIPAGTKVAVVGETGSGKTTFVKLLCRLADPVEGRIDLNGIDLRQVDPVSRLASVRMVPQDGFLFDTSVGTNVGYGNEGSTDEDVRAAFDALDLGWWVEKLPDGLGTEVGERGENLSVGERQLVALARAQLADPGLLVLDEATSAVDPEIDQALTVAIRSLAQGRTLVSVAHRLATAEAADLVLVFHDGRLVERGSHAELVAAGGRYTELHRAWIGNTRTSHFR